MPRSLNKLAANLALRLVTTKQNYWFFLDVANAQLAVFVLGALMPDSLSMGAFRYHRCIFLLACIDLFFIVTYNRLVNACIVKTAAGF